MSLVFHSREIILLYFLWSLVRSNSIWNLRANHVTQPMQQTPEDLRYCSGKYKTGPSLPEKFLEEEKFGKKRRRRRKKMEGKAKKNETRISKSLIWIVVISAVFSSVSAIDDKCSACNAVAAELELGLSNEKPRNHLDMRHRLDSKGQREGKVIDYRVSDLRVVELLDGLCKKMQDYTLEKMDSGRQAWVKVKDWDKLQTDKQEARAYSKAMSSFCGRLLEETEDELSDWIKRGSVQTGSVSKALCQDLSKHCSISRGYSEMDDREL